MICTSGRFCLPGLFLVPWLALGSGLGVHRALAAAQPGGPAREEPPAAAQVVGRARGPAEAAGRVDRLGDPLPPGALLRLGTVRFQHGKGIEAAALAPDGKLLVTAGTDAVRVWDTATGRAVAEHEGLPLPRGFGDARWYVAVSPDGRSVACGLEDGDVRFWDLATGRALPPLETTAPGAKPVLPPGALPVGAVSPAAALRAIAYSPDGRRLATTTEKGPVRVWELATHREVLQVPAAGALVNFSPDGRALAVYGEDTQTIALVAAADGKPLARFTHPVPAYRTAFSPHGRLLATVGDDLTVRVWETATGRQLHALAHPSGNSTRAMATAAAFSPDGRLLATGATDAVVRLWDPATGQEQRALRGHANWVTGLLFAPDGRTLYSVSWDKTVKRWDPASGEERPVVEDAGRHAHVALSPDGRLLASAGGRDGTVYLTEVATGRRLHALAGHPGYVQALDFSADGRLLARGGDDQLTRLWDTASGRLVRTIGEPNEPRPNEKPTISGLAFAPDGRSLATVRTYEGKARLWEVTSGKSLGELPQPGATQVAYSPDGRTVAVGATFKSGITLWDAGSRRQLRSIADSTNGMAFSPDGRLLATGHHGGKITLWDVRTGDRRKDWATGQEVVWSVAFTPGGLELLSGGTDGALRLWDPMTGQELARRDGHRGWVLRVACAPDGRTMVSGSMDDTALVWDLRPAPQPLPRGGAAVLWEALADGGAEAYLAGWALVDHPAEAVRVLKERLKPAPAADDRQVDRLAADLGSEDFDTRQTAWRKLVRLGAPAVPRLTKALAAAAPGEVRQRLQEVLDRISEWCLWPEERRESRALRALEHLATPEARRLLEELAKGAPEARLTQEAKAALERLAPRPAATP